MLSIVYMSRLLPVVTYRAWKKINTILQYSILDSMIYSAKSGGCNGFTFNLDILNNENKINLDTKKVPPSILYSPIAEYQQIYIDPTSELFLYDTEIDYISEDYTNNQFESRFIFTIDTSIMSSCGCGTSFSRR